MTEEKIKVNGLSYSIEENEILKDISFNVDDKKIVGIIGPNGSGKTTLLKHIYRALPVDRHKVFINNKALEKYSYNESAKSLTVVKQENISDFDYTVEGMVLLGRSPYRKSYESFNAEDYKIAHKALESIGMSGFLKRSFNELSGGEKQRVLIARSLAQQADIYILDEPTNHLDVHFQWSLMELIKNLNTTVLGVFHEMNLAAFYCDELIVLNNGHIVTSGTPNEVITPKLLSDVFGVKAEVVYIDNEKPHIIIKGQNQLNNCLQ